MHKRTIEEILLTKEVLSRTNFNRGSYGFFYIDIEANISYMDNTISEFESYLESKC